MTKALSSYEGVARVQKMLERLKKNTGGLGYLAAVDAAARIEAGKKAKAAAEAKADGGN